MNGFPDIANGLIEACQAFDLEDSTFADEKYL
jgi:hypothetical protein